MSSTIIFTGVSSFTGTWFAQELARSGHHVRGILARPRASYQGLRAQRVASLQGVVDLVDDAPMGSARFMRAISSLSDVKAVCWHHAIVGDYLADDYPVGDAITQGIQGAAQAAQLLAERNCEIAIVTRSVFEPRQGEPSGGPAIGMYGVAKLAVSEALDWHMAQAGIPVKHYVLCNPVGPLEESRLTAYLIRSWQKDVVPELRAGKWVRDNLPIDLLARDYVSFLVGGAGVRSINRTPSFWAMSNYDWALRIAEQFSGRLGLLAPIAVARHQDQSQPLVRTGRDRISADSNWSEAEFWASYAAYYRPR